jgi:hypothetical protein
MFSKIGFIRKYRPKRFHKIDPSTDCDEAGTSLEAAAISDLNEKLAGILQDSRPEQRKVLQVLISDFAQTFLLDLWSKFSQKVHQI